MIDVASRIHGKLGIFDDPLEEELYESYKEAVEANSDEAMEAWRKRHGQNAMTIGRSF